MKKIVISFIVGASIVGSTFYFSNSKETSSANSTAKIAEIENPSETDAEVRKNIMKRYVDDIDSIFKEIGPALPVLKIEDKNQVEKVKTAQEWIIKNGELDKGNEIVLSLSDDGEGQNNTFIVGAMIFKKQAESELNMESMNIERLRYGQIILVKENGKWKVKEFIRKL
ncbi:hypothetical protein EEL32_02050 [Brevibacillus laterosporus]|uniref:Uncharacterized protein n=1 Tax=Brevibacillus laterosporus TaxID=1465 RepID=A0A502H5I8_BRELA|nr:hypothetical protein [Brevibacillus laterosporus]QDX95084.1 hypothetical protein EEL30_24005 [Brevibacillus laterosporus]TPG68995.1 hypothetical protein EEL31_10970 [Brevibacillus laterosporus]TPG92100.1 hypothetical protein EEL32_02050 [Brevibacillus laterosporus]